MDKYDEKAEEMCLMWKLGPHKKVLKPIEGKCFSCEQYAQALREAAAEAIEDVRDSWDGGTLSDFIQHIESKIAALRGKS